MSHGLEGECAGRIGKSRPSAFHRRPRGRPGGCGVPVARGVGLVLARQGGVPGRLPIAGGLRDSEREGLQDGPGCGPEEGSGHTPGRCVRRQGRGRRG